MRAVGGGEQAAIDQFLDEVCDPGFTWVRHRCASIACGLRQPTARHSGPERDRHDNRRALVGRTFATGDKRGIRPRTAAGNVVEQAQPEARAVCLASCRRSSAARFAANSCPPMPWPPANCRGRVGPAARSSLIWRTQADMRTHDGIPAVARIVGTRQAAVTGRCPA